MESITVIGAGIVGVSIVHHLARNGGSDVTLVDASLPVGGTGTAGMAWLNASNKRPRDYFDLNFAGVREYHAWKERSGFGWIHLTGAVAGESYAPGLAERMDELTEWGYRVERLTGSDVTEDLDGQVAVRDPGELFAHYPDEGWIDVPAALAHLLDQTGTGRLTCRFGCPVSALEKDGGGFTVTLSDGTRFPTDQIVNAAGPSADHVAGLLGRRLPLAPTHGLTVRLHAPHVRMDKVVHSGSVGIRPDGPGFYRIHHESVDRLLDGPAPDRGDLVRTLHESAAALVPALASARVVAEYIGVRPIPADSFSSIGRVQRIPGYLEAVTHSGVTLGPLVGRLVADLVRTGIPDPLLTPRFSPDRFDQDGGC